MESRQVKKPQDCHRPRGIGAVSYTHLDVYKRQVLLRALQPRLVRIVQQHDVLEAIDQLAHGLRPVSYTHLCPGAARWLPLR